MPTPSEPAHPHAGTRLLRLGPDLPGAIGDAATSALVLLHGCGAAPEDMAGLAQAFYLPEGMLGLAPEAQGRVWYPQRLTAPRAQNDPYLSSALRRAAGFQRRVYLAAGRAAPAAGRP